LPSKSVAIRWISTLKDGETATQFWSLYGKTDNAHAHTQRALQKYEALHKDSLNPEVLALLNRADAFGQGVFLDVIAQIRRSEALFEDSTVTRWVNEGRVKEVHAPLFRKLIAANKPIQPTPQSGAADG